MKTKLKRTLSVVVFAALATAIVILMWLNSARKPSEIKIGVVIYNDEDAFLSIMMADLHDRELEYEATTGLDVSINIAGSISDQTIQDEQVEHFISMGYDVLLVNLVDRTRASNIINKAMSADIPVVFFNREPVPGDMNKWDKLFYVGSNAKNSADLEAQIVIDKYRRDRASIDLNGDGVIQYVMLSGEARHQDAMIRTEYSVKALIDAGLELKLIDSGVGNWELGQAKEIVERIMLERGGEVELIICNNDDMAVGAAEAVRSLGLDFSNIVGIDGTDDGIAAVDRGAMLGTVDVHIENHARALFDLAVTLARGDDAYTQSGWVIDPNKSVRLPMDIYIKDNI